MNAQLKQKVDQQFYDMYPDEQPIDAKEFWGSIVVCIGLVVLAYLWFSLFPSALPPSAMPL